MSWRAWSCAVAALSAVSAARGLTIEYALDRPAALIACDEQANRGDRAGAVTCYRTLVAQTAGPRIKGKALMPPVRQPSESSWNRPK